jgi:hypothetical protein
MREEKVRMRQLLMVMVPYIWENGRKDYLMEKGECIFQMVLFSLDFSDRDSRMDKGD